MASKAKGRCPLEPRQRLSLWNPLMRFGKGARWHGLCRARSERLSQTLRVLRAMPLAGFQGAEPLGLADFAPTPFAVMASHE